MITASETLLFFFFSSSLLLVSSSLVSPFFSLFSLSFFPATVLFLPFSRPVRPRPLFSLFLGRDCTFSAVWTSTTLTRQYYRHCQVHFCLHSARSTTPAARFLTNTGRSTDQSLASICRAANLHRLALFVGQSRSWSLLPITSDDRCNICNIIEISKIFFSTGSCAVCSRLFFIFLTKRQNVRKN